MSIHPSLRSAGGAGGSRRNVMKRHERVRHLMEAGSWPEGRSVFGLPKIKQMKVKARKAAPKEEKAATPSGEQPAAAPGTPAPK
ncbi:MAG: small basic protein [Candidatus Omnitrophica bacterium]|nr:small basic protein [Candidatus Omnitrophota bacterium]